MGILVVVVAAAAGVALAHFAVLEEVGDFDLCGFRSIGAVDGVCVNRFGKISADGSGRCFLRIGCTHDVAVFGDGVFAFEHHDQDGAGCHELDEVFEERTVFMDCIEAFRILAGKLFHFRSDDLKSLSFKARNDRADIVACYGIRLKNGQSLFFFHGIISGLDR
jgi:hypothetical protein